MADPTRAGTFGLGAVLAAVGASACCALPLLAATVGVGSAAAAAKLEPLRPLFVVATAVFLGVGFYRSYRRPRCEPGEACAVPANARRQRIVLWVAAVLAALALTLPYWAGWVL